MRLPFVSRLAFELLEAERNALRMDLANERVRSAECLTLLLRLKGAGAVLQPEQVVRLAPREPSVFERAVDLNPKARHDGRLRSHLLRWADDEKAKGVDEQAIADRLASWGDVTHDDPDEEAL